ncbi:ralA-binding protein 1 [Patella vulgata]|uniref:ralA-binding protein 1 n=1 Tax=Patella vulgata TaxID=6465 RepID=UPI00217F5117|nr:ralA-binding protein 1 [Patella vulgata]XP_050412575.1 ralA-binding protein 1 [Patella vulgata]XP_050412576.1 ralA-binding protein 1 [Patella vulgata]
MSFDSQDSEKAFQVAEESKKKDGKKKDGKRDKKEKGYVVFEEEESDREVDDVKSPNKGKRGKAGFKFPASKNIFPKAKDEKKDKESKKEEKKKRKEKKKSKRVQIVRTTELLDDDEVQPVFGVPLEEAVERNKSHDGIELPAIFRECIDYIEEHGLECEGIYRISGVKSKVQHLKDCYNKGFPAYLEEHEPNIVASLLKMFLRDLPEPVLTTALMSKFEEASTIRNSGKLVEQFSKLISDLPTCNRLLLSWMIVHMAHIIHHQKKNKMTLQNVSIVLSPTMQISHRVLNVLFSHCSQLFHDTQIKKYVPPLKPATSRWSLELPDNPTALEEELAKQESLLNQLHTEINAGKADANKEEQLWEVQRVVTQLKRKIKFATKAVEAAEKRRKDLEQKMIATNSIDAEEMESKTIPKEEKKKVTLKVEDDEVEAPEPPENPVDEEKEEIKETKTNSAEMKKEVDDAEKQVEESVEEQEEVRTIVSKEVDNLKKEESNPVAKEAEPLKEEVVKKPNIVKEEVKETKKRVVIKEDKPPTVKPAAKHQLATQTSIHEPLKPIKAAPVVPKKPEDTSDEDRKKKRREELRALERELMGYKQEEEDLEDAESENKDKEESEEQSGNENDEEYQQLLQEEYALKLEQEELLVIGDELHQKIETEEKEIERLHQEIQELQYLRHDSDLEDVSSSSDSSYDSDDDEDLEEILHQLIIENERLEKKNSEFCQKIHEERMICLSVKLQIRLLQQKQLGMSQSVEKEMLI